MKIAGSIRITIEGKQGSGKTQLSGLVKDALDERGINWMEFSEGAEYKDYGQKISIIEKQTK